jgi:hypothetical protein
MSGSRRILSLLKRQLLRFGFRPGILVAGASDLVVGGASIPQLKPPDLSPRRPGRHQRPPADGVRAGTAAPDSRLL